MFLFGILLIIIGIGSVLGSKVCQSLLALLLGLLMLAGVGLLILVFI